MKEMLRIGWKEKVAFPTWGMSLRARVEPSEALSTLSVERVEAIGRVRDEEGRRRLVLKILVPLARGKSRSKTVHAFYHRRTRLGEAEGRHYVIRVPLRVGGTLQEAELALLPSERRQHFLHLGRELLSGRFLVDSSVSYLHRIPRTSLEADPLLPLPGTD
ncbi:MAG: RimK/LysX family protein [Candidatus Krumholzibacteria bacterium]|jgi:hypothetical protein|nr:RimK/LysX family protein [Candidatus Krumholzibacteria bacterium]MDP6669224.1 RimK/LysX family protein [Candidatus Krumholzibacteria bacterium]MDP6796467.1 RimK/LysX family protein [Candidatus Krumholzibacteria bacterium]MDP7021597.1 RimK/LysX family protein [Candidatus Krumholzibacteria bacterium]